MSLLTHGLLLDRLLYTAKRTIEAPPDGNVERSISAVGVAAHCARKQSMGSSTSRTAFVETVDHDAGDMDMHEWRSAASALELLGFRVLRFTSSEITTLAINVTTPVIGGRRSMRLALTQIQALQENQPLPERSDYPVCLVSLLGRTITESTLGEALQALELEGCPGPTLNPVRRSTCQCRSHPQRRCRSMKHTTRHLCWCRRSC